MALLGKKEKEQDDSVDLFEDSKEELFAETEYNPKSSRSLFRRKQSFDMDITDLLSDDLSQPLFTEEKDNKKEEKKKEVKTEEKELQLLEERATIDNTKSFLLKIGGHTMNKRLESMGTSVEDIKKFQLFRIIKSLAVLVIVSIISLAFKTVDLVFVGVIGAIAMWFMEYQRVNSHYQSFQFQRQLDFNKFIRMLMPYLRGNNVVLYKAFEKMKDRLDDGTTRTALVTLITKLNSQPNSRAPFEEFSENSSGQERSKLIMQTLYDFQRSSNDSTTINELGKLVDEELSKDIDEIITRKDDRFELEAYMLGFCLLIPTMGYFLSIATSMITKFMPK